MFSWRPPSKNWRPNSEKVSSTWGRLRWKRSEARKLKCLKQGKQADNGGHNSSWKATVPKWGIHSGGMHRHIDGHTKRSIIPAGQENAGPGGPGSLPFQQHFRGDSRGSSVVWRILLASLGIFHQPGEWGCLWCGELGWGVQGCRLNPPPHRVPSGFRKHWLWANGLQSHPLERRNVHPRRRNKNKHKFQSTQIVPHLIGKHFLLGQGKFLIFHCGKTPQNPQK